MHRFVSPGPILGVIAVALAMTGSAVAASRITGAQIRNGTITGRDIRNGSVSASKLTGSARVTLRGEPGPAGPQGPAGPVGPSAASVLNPVTSAPVPFAIGFSAQSTTANCPAGQRVVSGGGVSTSVYGLVASRPNTSRTGWFVVGRTPNSGLAGQYVQAFALCAPANVAVAASAGSTIKDKAEIDRIVADVNAQGQRKQNLATRTARLH
jgi:hypothetical protein